VFQTTFSRKIVDKNRLEDSDRCPRSLSRAIGRFLYNKYNEINGGKGWAACYPHSYYPLQKNQFLISGFLSCDAGLLCLQHSSGSLHITSNGTKREEKMELIQT
jgi:hypothetical protein